LQACSISQRDYILSLGARLQVFDPAEVDEDRTVDTKENLRIKRFLERVHGHMEQVTHSASVQFHLILRGSYPIHAFDIHEHSLAS
jgi:hypothetical protein